MLILGSSLLFLISMKDSVRGGGGGGGGRFIMGGGGAGPETTEGEGALAGAFLLRSGAGCGCEGTPKI